MKNFDFKAETERLIIRPLKKEDYKSWLKGFMNRLPSQHKYDEGKFDMGEYTEEWFAELVNRHQELALNDRGYVLDVFQKNNGKHIGMIDFSTLARDDFQWGRIGYTIHNQYWREGLGKEAVKAALTIAFEDLRFHRMEAHINVDNIASIRLAESVGMKFECMRKGFIREYGEWKDILIFYKNAI